MTILLTSDAPKLTSDAPKSDTSAGPWARGIAHGSFCSDPTLITPRKRDLMAERELAEQPRNGHAGRPEEWAPATPQEIIEEARNGRMYILVDEHRSNEADLVIPAQMATPDAINFMAAYGRGLICLALTEERVAQLELPPMTQSGDIPHKATFTVSIEARDGVTTGISAADRARTISVAIDACRSATELVTPGHVFPLAARVGGVLVRAGHAEAAVDVSRLAGLNPSGVICGIMSDDGLMAELEALVLFARQHGLKIGTIGDLISYRRRHDRVLQRRSEQHFLSCWGGDWSAVSFVNDATGVRQLVLQKGEVDPTKPTPIRLHAFSTLADIFAEKGHHRGLLQRAMEIIAARGRGVIVMVGSAYEAGPFHGYPSTSGQATNSDDLEISSSVADVLCELGVGDMILISESEHQTIALDGYGLTVVDRIPIASTEARADDRESDV